MQILCEMTGDRKITNCFHPLCGKEIFYEDYEFKRSFHKRAVQTTGSEQFFFNCNVHTNPLWFCLKKQFFTQWAWMGAGFLRVWQAPWWCWCCGSPGWGNWGKAGQARGGVSAPATPPACSVVLAKSFSLLDLPLLQNTRIWRSYFFRLLQI